MIIDLHCHSTASDGSLSPVDLVRRAEAQGVELLAITDHDVIDGYLAVQEGSSALQLVSGVELSCCWGKTAIHVLGLRFDPANPVLVAGLQAQQQARVERAQMIAGRLAKKGFDGTYQGACRIAAGSQLGRPHFARFLLEQGHVSSIAQAFKRYLGAGKIGDVKQVWPELAEVLGWVAAAGGAAVLAHPLHYKMTATKLRALIADFKEAGGQGLEVISGKQSKDRTTYLAHLCERFELQASCGSDFHQPGMTWSELGNTGRLPSTCQPVWADWV